MTNKLFGFWHLDFGIWILAFGFWILLSILSGCARTVTTVGTVGSQITFTVRTREALKASNRYFIVFGRTAAPQIPFLPKEMVQPREPATTSDVNYFTDFYSSWSDYVLVQGQSAQLFRGPFTATASPEPISIFEFQQPADNQFKFTYALRLMSFAPTIPERLFIDIVTVDPSKHVADNLSSNFPAGTVSSLVLPTDVGTTKTASDEGQTVPDGSLDLLDYTIAIQ